MTIIMVIYKVYQQRSKRQCLSSSLGQVQNHFLRSRNYQQLARLTSPKSLGPARGHAAHGVLVEWACSETRSQMSSDGLIRSAYLSMCCALQAKRNMAIIQQSMARTCLQSSKFSSFNFYNGPPPRQRSTVQGAWESGLKAWSV